MCIAIYVKLTVIIPFITAMLSWFVDQCKMKLVLRKEKLIEENEVECRPERISNAILDQSVDVHLIRHYFTTDAWLIVQDVLQRKRDHHVWICQGCNHDLDEGESEAIMCDSCLEWFHFGCVGIIKRPKLRYWYCRDCYKDKT